MVARLSDAASAGACRLSGRHWTGRHRPPDRATAGGAARPAIRRRGPGGGRQQHGGAGCRGRARRRLHVAARRQRQCGQRQPLSEPAVQFRARHRGRRHDLQRAVSAGGQSGIAGENVPGVHRLRQSQSGPDQYGVARCRHHAAPHVRVVADDDGHRIGSCALSDRLHTRSPQRPGAGRVFDDNPVAPVRQRRPVARASP